MTTTYCVGNAGHDLRQAHKCDSLKPFNGIPTMIHRIPMYITSCRYRNGRLNISHPEGRSVRFIEYPGRIPVVPFTQFYLNYLGLLPRYSYRRSIAITIYHTCMLSAIAITQIYYPL